jgi:hypothetical protein
VGWVGGWGATPCLLSSSLCRQEQPDGASFPAVRPLWACASARRVRPLSSAASTPSQAQAVLMNGSKEKLAAPRCTAGTPRCPCLLGPALNTPSARPIKAGTQERAYVLLQPGKLPCEACLSQSGQDLVWPHSWEGRESRGTCVLPCPTCGLPKHVPTPGAAVRARPVKLQALSEGRSIVRELLHDSIREELRPAGALAATAPAAAASCCAAVTC